MSEGMDSKVKYLSFDVYDTLVQRLVTPERIYRVMEELLRDAGEQIEDFATRRVRAESQLQQANGKPYTLEEIYTSAQFSELTREERERLMALEERLERDNAIPNARMRRLFERCAMEHEVICISDMYFSEAFMTEMLERNGYHPTRLFVSSEAGCSKKSGGLYRYALDALGAEGKDVLHMGDAVRSDWRNARRAGLQAKWVRRAREWEPSGDDLYNIGFRVFGPVVFAFCRWIREESHGEKLLFLAREGEFLKECYDAMYPGNQGRVIYLSRKAVMQGSACVLLEGCSAEAFREAMCVQERESVAQVLRRLGLDARAHEEQLRSLGLCAEDAFDERMDPFFERNREELLEELQLRSEEFEAYLAENLEERNVLVDIGWKGRMQNLLTRYLELRGEQKTLRGLYLGIKECDGKRGFLFEGTQRRCQDILCFSGLLEILMMPKHGSTVGYRRGADGMEPIFAELEFSEENYEKIRRVQQGMLGLIERCKGTLPGECFDTDEVAKKMIRFGCHPPRKALEELGALELYENGEKFRLAVRPKVGSFREIKDGFYHSKWKSGYMKNLTGVDFPYEILIGCARKLLGGGKH